MKNLFNYIQSVSFRHKVFAFKHLLFLVSLQICSSAVYAQYLHVADDPTFNTFSGSGSPLRGSKVQSDGKIILTGDFLTYGGVAKGRVIRILSSGAVDNTFATGQGLTHATNNLVYAQQSIIQSDNKILVCGSFSAYNGATAMNIVRINSSGTRDATFNSALPIDFPVSAMCLQPDGKIIVGGVTPNTIKRLNADGTIDATFTPHLLNVSLRINTIVLQPDGKIIVGGGFSYSGGSRLIRLNANGTRDLTFVPISLDDVYCTILKSDGTLLVSTASKIYQLNADGTLNSGFTTVVANAKVETIMQQPDGKIIAGGNFTTVNGTAKNRIVRFSATGIIDPTFDPGTGFNDNVTSSSILSDGTIILTGWFKSFNDDNAFYLAKLNSDGSRNWVTNAAYGVDQSIRSSAMQADDKIIVGGDFTSYNSIARNKIARIKPDGYVDLSFNPGVGADDRVSAIAVQSDQKIIIAGRFLNYGGVARSKIARLNTNGTLDGSFVVGSGANNEIRACAIQSDGKIIIGGNFTSYNGVAVGRIARLNTDGSLDATFTTATGFDGPIHAIIIQPDGQILASGAYYYFNGVLRPRIARLNTDGTLETTFVSANGYGNTSIDCMALQPDGKVVIGGNFNSFYNTNSTQRIARLNADGTTDMTFSPSVSIYNFPLALLVQPDGKIMIGASSISRVNSNGASDPSFPYMTATQLDVTTLQLNAGGNVLAFGIFNISTGYKKGTARLKTMPAINSTQTVSACGSYTWINGVTYTSSNTTATVTHTDVYGTDSIVALNLTILQPTSTTVNETTCGSFIWPQTGETYTVSGQYIDTIQNVSGCDSIVTLDLTILQLVSSTVNEAACESYTWLQTGETYTVSGQYIDTIQNVSGCDSIVTLDLTILQSTNSTVNETACESYTWPQTGETYTFSGQYADTIQNAAGCDSIITLDLTILQPTSSTVNETSCGTFTWSQTGETYTFSGQYQDTIPNAAGCDSIVTLDLTIIPALPIVISSFSIPADTNNCTGALSITITGNADFTLDLDGTLNTVSSGYSLLSDLCPGLHDLKVTDNCGDTTSISLVVPIATNYIFNDPFIGSLALDSLGSTVEDCDIFYSSIDSAYIDSVFATGNIVTVYWNIIDAFGSHIHTVSYDLDNGNGVYYLQLNVFCPTKALGNYYTVTQSIYFINGAVSIAAIDEHSFVNQFKIFPNPTNDHVTIQFDHADVIRLSVLDAAGRKLFDVKHLFPGEQVSLEALPSGVYFFNFSSESENTVKRIVLN